MSNEQLWAPWRLSYITGEKNEPELGPDRKLLAGADEQCFLCCAVPDGQERQRYVVERGEHTIVVLNRYPYNNGHLLVAPKRHVANLSDLNDAEQMEISRTITRMVTKLEKLMNPHGFNIGINLGRAAGAGLPGHLHWHIVPRWIGDTNFMPTIAGVHAIPQSLEALWELMTTNK